jgi:hypothetical protein
MSFLNCAGPIKPTALSRLGVEHAVTLHFLSRITL